MVDQKSLPERDQEHIFMTVDGIEGEVNVEDFSGTIAVREFNYTVELPLTTERTRGGATRDKSIHSQAVIRKVADKSSVKLFQNCCEGTQLDEVKFEFIRFSQGEMVVARTLTLSEVFGSRFKHLGEYPADSDLPMEEVAFDFATVTDTYTQQKPDGSMSGNVEFGWDRLNGKAL